MTGLIAPIARHRLTIIGHKHPVSSHHDVRRDVLGQSNYCESSAICYQVAICVLPSLLLFLFDFSIPGQDCPYYSISTSGGTFAIGTLLDPKPAVSIRTTDVSPLASRYSICLLVEWRTSYVRPSSRKFMYTCRLGLSICTINTSFSCKLICS